MCSFPVLFSSYNYACFLTSPMHAVCMAQLILLDLITLIMFRQEYKLKSSSLFSCPHFLCLMLKYSQLSVVKHAQRMIFSLSEFKATGNIIVLCVLDFTFLGSRRKTKKYELKDTKHSLNVICSSFLRKYV